MKKIKVHYVIINHSTDRFNTEARMIFKSWLLIGYRPIDGQSEEMLFGLSLNLT